MAIEEVQGYKDRLLATIQAMQATAPERVAAKDGFIAIYQTLALTHKMFHEYGYAFDASFFRHLRESLGHDLVNLTTALQQQGIQESNVASEDVQKAIARMLTSEQRREVINKFLEDVNSEVKASQKDFHKVVRELERQHRHRHAAGTATSAESPTHSPLTNFGGFVPGELASALQGLLSKDALQEALAVKAGQEKQEGGALLSLGVIQNSVTALLLALQSQVVKRSGVIAVQQINQALPGADLTDPKLGLFADAVALEGLLGVNESGLIPDLLEKLLENKLPQLSSGELESAVQALSPLLAQSLLQLNTARVLSYLPQDLKNSYIKLFQEIQQQVEKSLSAEASSTAAISLLKQQTAAFLEEAFPALAPKQLDHLVARIVTVLFGPTSVPSRDASSFKRTIRGSPAATPTPSTPPLLSSDHFQEFQHQLRFPKPLKELLTEEAARQLAEAEGVQQTQLHQMNRAFFEASQRVANAVASRSLRMEARKDLARAIDRELSQLGEALLSDQLAAKEQQRSNLADDFHDLSANAGQTADKIYLLTVLANLQRVQEVDKREALRSELQAPLTASLALALQNAGIPEAQSLAAQVAQTVTGPDFAVSILKRLQPAPAAATALAEAKAEAAVTQERKKVTEVLPSVIESLVKLSNRDREARKHDNLLSDIREEATRESPRFKETNYLSAFLENQLDPAVKYERRGGIQPALMEYNSQIEKEIKANPGMV